MPKTPQDSDGWVEEHNSLTRRNIPRVDPSKICGFSRSRFHGLKTMPSPVKPVPFVAYHWGGSRNARGGIHYRRVGLDDGRRVAAGAKTLAK